MLRCSFELQYVEIPAGEYPEKRRKNESATTAEFKQHVISLAICHTSQLQCLTTPVDASSERKARDYLQSAACCAIIILLFGHIYAERERVLHVSHVD